MSTATSALGEGIRLLRLPATARATALGNVRVANIILLGALSYFLPIPEQVWHDLLEQRIPERFLAINRQAFRLGRGP